MGYIVKHPKLTVDRGLTSGALNVAIRLSA
jgi:hypothetical protein